MAGEAGADFPGGGDLSAWRHRPVDEAFVGAGRPRGLFQHDEEAGDRARLDQLAARAAGVRPEVIACAEGSLLCRPVPGVSGDGLGGDLFRQVTFLDDRLEPFAGLGAVLAQRDVGAVIAGEEGVELAAVRSLLGSADVGRAGLGHAAEPGREAQLVVDPAPTFVFGVRGPQVGHETRVDLAAKRGWRRHRRSRGFGPRSCGRRWRGVGLRWRGGRRGRRHHRACRHRRGALRGFAGDEPTRDGRRVEDRLPSAPKHTTKACLTVSGHGPEIVSRRRAHVSCGIRWVITRSRAAKS